MVSSKRASGSHHPKRYGHHQRHTKPFLKTYLPYLPLLLIILTGLVFAFRGPSRAFRDVLAYATNVSNQSLLEETNAQRLSHAQPVLTTNDQLTAAAQAKADDMASRNYWSHVTPDGQQPWAFIDRAGYSYQKAGENLAYGFSNSAATVAGWMNSPSHKANLLDGAFDEVGFGFANAASYQNAGNSTIIVAMYGRSQSAAALPSPAEPAASEPIVQSDDQVAAANARTYRVARIQIITNGAAPWSVALLITLAGVGICFILVKHSFKLHKAVHKGEKFVLTHPLFDVTVISFVALCVLVSRVEGYILSASF